MLSKYFSKTCSFVKSGYFEAKVILKQCYRFNKSFKYLAFIYVVSI